MSIRKWTDGDGVYHRRVFRCSYRILAWAEFEPTTTEIYVLYICFIEYGRLLIKLPWYI